MKSNLLPPRPKQLPCHRPATAWLCFAEELPDQTSKAEGGGRREPQASHWQLQDVAPALQGSLQGDGPQVGPPPKAGPLSRAEGIAELSAGRPPCQGPHTHLRSTLNPPPGPASHHRGGTQGRAATSPWCLVGGVRLQGLPNGSKCPWWMTDVFNQTTLLPEKEEGIES